MVIKGVIDSSLPLAPEDTDWSASEAIKALKEKASNSDGDINFTTYKKGFFYVEDGGGDKQGDYKLPFATVIDGEIKAVWNGVAAAMGALNGARGGVDMSDLDKEDVYHEICTYYKRFDKTPPDLSKSLKREVGERVDVMFNIEQSTVKSLGDGTFEAIVTTADLDRYQESIDTEGITTKNYMNNPVVLYGHDYQGLPIGKALKLTKQKDDTGKKTSMVARFQLAVQEYPFAATVADMIKGGFLNAVSIGGVVTSWSDDWRTILGMDMVEFSVVPVPANPGAIITGRSFEKATGKSVQQVSKEYHDFVQKSVADKLKGVDSDGLKRYIESLEGLVTLLKATSEKASDGTEDEAVKLTLRKAGGKVSQTGQEIIKLVKGN